MTKKIKLPIPFFTCRSERLRRKKKTMAELHQVYTWTHDTASNHHYVTTCCPRNKILKLGSEDLSLTQSGFHDEMTVLYAYTPLQQAVIVSQCGDWHKCYYNITYVCDRNAYHFRLRVIPVSIRCVRSRNREHPTIVVTCDKKRKVKIELTTYPSDLKRDHLDMIFALCDVTILDQKHFQEDNNMIDPPKATPRSTTKTKRLTQRADFVHIKGK
jgi:hypothetical protein